MNGERGAVVVALEKKLSRDRVLCIRIQLTDLDVFIMRSQWERVSYVMVKYFYFMWARAEQRTLCT